MKLPVPNNLAVFMACHISGALVMIALSILWQRPWWHTFLALFLFQHVSFETGRNPELYFEEWKRKQQKQQTDK